MAAIRYMAIAAAGCGAWVGPAPAAPAPAQAAQAAQATQGAERARDAQAHARMLAVLLQRRAAITKAALPAPRDPARGKALEGRRTALAFLDRQIARARAQLGK